MSSDALCVTRLCVRFFVCDRRDTVLSDEGDWSYQNFLDVEQEAYLKMTEEFMAEEGF